MYNDIMNEGYTPGVPWRDRKSWIQIWPNLLRSFLLPRIALDYRMFLNYFVFCVPYHIHSPCERKPSNYVP